VKKNVNNNQKRTKKILSILNLENISESHRAGGWWGNPECNPKPWLRNLEKISEWECEIPSKGYFTK